MYLSVTEKVSDGALVTPMSGHTNDVGAVIFGRCLTEIGLKDDVTAVKICRDFTYSSTVSYVCIFIHDVLTAKGFINGLLWSRNFSR